MVTRPLPLFIVTTDHCSLVMYIWLWRFANHLLWGSLSAMAPCRSCQNLQLGEHWDPILTYLKMWMFTRIYF
jgi:hypothetical protein